MVERSRAEELYDQHRDKVWQDIKSGTDNFDKYMLTFSSGALALSLTFIRAVVPVGKTVCIPLLIISWVWFVFCILITLISFRLSIRALEDSIPHLNAYYLEGDEDAFNKHMDSWLYKAIEWCAWSAGICFVLGLIFTIMFMGANLQEAKRVNQEKKPATAASAIELGEKPVAMTPVNQTGVRKQANDALNLVTMTPVAREDRGIKPVPVTPVPPTQPAPAPSQPAQGPRK